MIRPLRTLTIMSTAARNDPVVKKPERPVWPTYSWRSKGTHANLIYIRNCEHANIVLDRFKKSPVGFDLEWRPNYTKGQLENPVALCQLSNDEEILLVQVSAMQGIRMPPISFCIQKPDTVVPRISGQTSRPS